MKNMKISMKLIVSFLMLAALAVVVFIVGIVSMVMMNQADDDLYNNNLLAVLAVGKIDANYNAQRMYIRNYVIYESDDETFKSSETSLKSLEDEMLGLLDDYQKTITSDDDQKTFDELLTLYKQDYANIKIDVHDAGAANNTDKAKASLDEAAVIGVRISEIITSSMEFNASEAKDSVNNNTTLFTSAAIIEVAILIIAVIVAIVLAMYISKLIADPISKMRNIIDVVKTTGRMNFTDKEKNELKASASKDEVGESILAFDEMLTRLIEIANSLTQIANGDLRVNIKSISSEDTIGNAVNAMVENLNQMFGEINVASSQVNSGSDQVSGASQALSQGATEQASAIEQLSASIQEISSQVNENSENATRASTLADETRNEVQIGNEEMTQMLEAMSDINNSSNEISKIIKVIDDIAFQTNILALNAAVEAARAGEAGKGFAVVADEVRNLASKSADAAKQTTALIEGSVKSVENGAQIAQKTATSLEVIAKKTDEVGHIITGIADASRDQAVAISQINAGVEQISSVVQNNSATAEQSAAAAEELSGQANMLGDQISQFKLK